ncbi:hypothetical protein JTE90_014424 [Oedothorax gibbosus]|uniref:Toll-interacting protein n=1 Tax=Oedothorax gibbosus TaxID=931172 RepID=A0AAV6V2S7_9ARAC|nr:hypothetical protein JTE90_014424 [Oedothorax gibbosus]
MATCDLIKDDFESKREERRKQVMLGDLPSDFLRVLPISNEQQLSLDEQTAIALQHQYSTASSPSGRLTVSVVEAKLNKNYGLTRMDPYVRLRVGNTIYETNTDYNGARNPRWNKNFNCFFLTQDTSVYIEIFDECAFSLDERIAWGSYEIPKSVVLKGQTMNEWIPLSGKLGEEKEGSINLVITCTPIPTGSLIYHPKSLVTVVPYGPFNGDQGNTRCDDPRPPMFSAPQPRNPPPPEFSEDDLRQIKEMFPNMEGDIVRAVFESNNGHKEHTINALLELGDAS